MHLEEMLSTSVSSLEDTKSYVNQLQAQTALEKKERARYVHKMHVCCTLLD